MKFSLKVWDLLALLLSIAATAAFSLILLSQAAGPARVEIDAQEGHFIYPLDVDREVEIAGPLGPLYLEIEDGEVYIKEAPCAQKLCIAMGRIRQNGEWVACLPDRVLIRVTGGKTQEEVDVKTF